MISISAALIRKHRRHRDGVINIYKLIKLGVKPFNSYHLYNTLIYNFRTDRGLGQNRTAA